MTPETRAALSGVAATLQKIAATINDEGNAAVATGDHVEVVKHFHDLREINETIKDARQWLKDIEDAFSTTHIPDIFRAVRERTGQKPPFNIEGIGKVSVSHRFSCSIIGTDKTIGHNWLRENGHEGLVTETVNSSTLSAFAKDMLENKGEELPEDIFKTSLNPYTSIRKS